MKLKYATKNVKVYQTSNEKEVKKITGRTVDEFASMESIGTRLADDLLGSNFINQLYRGFNGYSFNTCIVEVNNRTKKGSKEYFAIRSNNDIYLTQDGMGRGIRFNGFEAALARFAMSVNHLGWNAENSDIVLGQSSYISQDQAFDYYHMAMDAICEFNQQKVIQFLD